MAHPLVVLAFAPNNLPQNRYGIVASRRLGNAVARNRAKRRLRETIRHWHPHLVPGYDVIFIAREPVAGASPAVLAEAVASVLRRAKLL